ncbi:MAG: nuclear transport factor 2 family protein [Ginsengibacter sp.]
MQLDKKTKNDTKAVIMAFYNALGARKTTEISQKFAETIDWYIPGAEHLAPWLGKRTKRIEVKEFFDTLLSNIESVSFDLEHVIVEEDFGVVTGKFISKMVKTGINYESPFSAHFQIAEGKIVYYRFLENSYGLLSALGIN